PQVVYNSERYGNFTYTIPNLMAGAAYTVRLHFGEIYWSSPGSRVFNVSINGTQVLANFDIFAAAGGKDIALIKEFATNADSAGKIAIQFSSVKDNAKLSGIEILTAGLSAPAGNTSVSLSSTASAGTPVWQQGGFNVTKYGLVGDGMTDNTAALQNLINKAPSATLFYFPAGTYLV